MSDSKLVAIIDVGSNTIHLVVYRVELATSRFKSLIDTKDSVGLSSYVSDGGVMSANGIAAGCRSVARLVRMSELAHCDHVSVFATAAVRNCANSTEVVRALSLSAGCEVRVLTGQEEARLSMVGALSSTGLKSGLFFDIGGGSTELAGLKKSGATAYDSLPMGSLSSWKHQLSGGFPSNAELKAIESLFLERLQESHVDVENYSQLCAIGGSMRLALKVLQRMDKGRRFNRVNVVTNADLERILQAAESDPSALAWHVLSIKPERISTFLPGCAIAHALLQASGCSSVRVSRTGLREGFLISEYCTGGALARLCKRLERRTAHRA